MFWGWGTVGIYGVDYVCWVDLVRLINRLLHLIWLIQSRLVHIEVKVGILGAGVVGPLYGLGLSIGGQCNFLPGIDGWGNALRRIVSPHFR